MPARQIAGKKKPGGNRAVLHESNEAMAIIPMQQVLTMTSREIADLVDSRHDSVKRTIERLVAQGVIASPPLVDFKNINNVAGQEYVFSGEQGKRDSIVVVAQLSPEFTARLVDRWQELEAAQAKPAELSRMDILKLAMESEQARIEAEKQLALAAPKVEFVDRYVEATGLFTFREVAKLLKANEARFREFLLVEKIMYRLGTGGKLTAYQNHVDAGRFEMKTDTAKNGHSYRSSMFTAKGVHWIAGEWAKANLEVAA